MGYSVVKDQTGGISPLGKPFERLGVLSPDPLAPSLVGPQRPTPIGCVAPQLLRALAASETSGEYRARTGDLLDANQALSQLS